MLRTGFRTFMRNQSTSSNWKITLTSDGTTAVALHPEEGVPYEQTRPMPEIVLADKNADSPLKMHIQDSYRHINNLPSMEAKKELARITHTTFHRWLPRKSSNKCKKTPMERPYL